MVHLGEHEISCVYEWSQLKMITPTYLLINAMSTVAPHDRVPIGRCMTLDLTTNVSVLLPWMDYTRTVDNRPTELLGFDIVCLRETHKAFDYPLIT